MTIEEPRESLMALMSESDVVKARTKQVAALTRQLHNQQLGIQK